MSAQYGRRWSLGFGQWGGVPVRLHWLMLLFFALATGVTLDGSWSTGLMTAGILLASVALHEAAHCISALRLGGEVDAVVLSPIGGLHSPRVPDEPEPQVFVALIGPMTNLTLVVASTVALLALQTSPEQLLSLLNPVAPMGLLDGSPAIVGLKQAIWINWALFLLNLLPAYPFDGGPALRATLWPLVGRRTAAVVTAHSAQAIAALLCVAAVFVEKPDPQAIMPLWIPLVTLAVFLFFSAHRDLALAHTLDATADASLRYPRKPEGYDLIDAAWQDEDDDMVLVEQAAESRADHRQHDADEASEDDRVDAILARLHHASFDQLSAEDRAVLQRASRRYRDRRHDEPE